MKSNFSISIDDVLKMWIDSKKPRSRSCYIEGVLYEIYNNEKHSDPKIIMSKIKEIDDRMVRDNNERVTLIKKMDKIIEIKNNIDIEKKNEIVALKQREKEKNKEIIGFVNKIPNIKKILKGAIANPSKFDYFSVIDTIRKIKGYERVSVVDLQLYVKHIISEVKK